MQKGSVKPLWLRLTKTLCLPNQSENPVPSAQQAHCSSVFIHCSFIMSNTWRIEHCLCWMSVKLSLHRLSLTVTVVTLQTSVFSFSVSLILASRLLSFLLNLLLGFVHCCLCISVNVFLFHVTFSSPRLLFYGTHSNTPAWLRAVGTGCVHVNPGCQW